MINTQQGKKNAGRTLSRILATEAKLASQQDASEKRSALARQMSSCALDICADD